ncbi:MAG: HlyD family efflux transporter periplasmic adaptor subunit [Planctomycetaceae bacterium]|nr:HlyD family efflux transporter periplasmic adaptor subunit [Planctomycetaceae bacterium]
MSKTRIAVVGIALGLSAAAVAAVASGVTNREAEPASAALRPFEALLPDDVLCFGIVDVDPGTRPLQPEASGRVFEVSVKENDFVHKGEALIRLDDEDARLRVAEAEAGVAAARTRIDQARNLPEQHDARRSAQQAIIDGLKSRIDQAESDLKLQKSAADSVSRNPAIRALEDQLRLIRPTFEAETARGRELDADDPQLSIRLAESELAAAEARLAIARSALEHTVLRAPEDGRVMRILAGIGEVISPASPQAVVLFCRAGPRVVRAEVDQEFAQALREGQSATVRDEAHPSREWAGTVTRVAEWYAPRRSVVVQPNQYADVRTLQCLIELDVAESLPRIGQTMEVRIRTHPAP